MISNVVAKNIITYFILTDDDYDVYKLLEEFNISKNFFDACAKTVKYKDIELYNKYLLKIKKIKINKYYLILDMCKDLAIGIENGIFMDGTPFDMLEFFKRLPFIGEEGKVDFKICQDVNLAIIESNLLFGKIDRFTEMADLDSNKIIINFVRENCLYRSKNVKELDLRVNYHDIRFYKQVIDKNGNIVIIDNELTNDIIYKAINYIKNNKLPLIIPVFELVLEKYFIGEINLEEIKPYKLIKTK